MASVTWTDPALGALNEACDYIREDSPRMAEIFANRAFAATDRLATFPALGRIVPEFEREDVREIILGNYRMYELVADEVQVTAFVHGAREIGIEIVEPNN